MGQFSRKQDIWSTRYQYVLLCSIIRTIHTPPFAAYIGGQYWSDLTGRFQPVSKSTMYKRESRTYSTYLRGQGHPPPNISRTYATGTFFWSLPLSVTPRETSITVLQAIRVRFHAVHYTVLSIILKFFFFSVEIFETAAFRRAAVNRRDYYYSIPCFYTHTHTRYIDRVYTADERRQPTLLRRRGWLLGGSNCSLDRAHRRDGLRGDGAPRGDEGFGGSFFALHTSYARHPAPSSCTVRIHVIV